jgi:anti-anti-sigma factor
LTVERRLRSDLSAAAGDQSRELVIDLRGVTFIDSSALAILVHADRQFQRQDRAIACVVREGPVQRLLDVTGLRRALHVFDTLRRSRRTRPGPRRGTPSVTGRGLPARRQPLEKRATT